MKLNEYRTRAINHPDILNDPDTELFVMTKLEDGSGDMTLHKVVAVLFGGKQIIFTFQEGICPPELEGKEEMVVIEGKLEKKTVLPGSGARIERALILPTTDKPNPFLNRLDPALAKPTSKICPPNLEGKEEEPKAMAEDVTFADYEKWCKNPDSILFSFTANSPLSKQLSEFMENQGE